MSATTLTVAALQDAFGSDLAENCARMQARVAEAAAAGAQVILPPELFQGPYFCQREVPEAFRAAFPTAHHPAVAAMREAARRHGVVIPTSFFERDGPHYYNSLALVDGDGAILGVYRKSHIPDGPGYEEKFYFRPGNSGFRVWETGYGTIGVGICWDQWFPECARAMALQGADVLFYPTAIGSEPTEPDFDSRPSWQRAMQGHAVCNVTPVVAANRVGDEDGQVFYGSSFICDQRGEKVAEANRTDPALLTATFDLGQVREDRALMGFFRDRRPDLYGDLTQR
jgi:N-carbamoylputrescine amidase